MSNEITNENLYSKISELLKQAKQNVVRAVNQTMVYTYFDIGRMIVEDEQKGKGRAEYGKQVLKELSKKLTMDFGKGFSERNLEQMRQFYLIYSISQTLSAKFLNTSENSNLIQELVALSLESDKSDNNLNSISQTLSAESSRFDTKDISKTDRIHEENAPVSSTQNSSTQLTNSQKFDEHSYPEFKLSWSHYLLLMRIERHDERRFYEIESFQNNWSLRELKRQYNSSLYERLALSRDKSEVKLLSQIGQIIEKPTDLLKDPYILEFLDLPDLHTYSESELEQALIDKLESFLLELGKGFTFVGRQVRLTIDEKHFRVDLVFYNRLLKCFVVIDLKIGELTHQDIGQMQMYVNYHDRFIKLPDENKTIGIILCKDKNQAMVEITLPEENKQIFASKYQTILPDKETFLRLLNQEN